MLAVFEVDVRGGTQLVAGCEIVSGEIARVNRLRLERGGEVIIIVL